MKFTGLTFITPFVGVALIRCFTGRQLFLLMGLCATLGLLLAGILAYPGVVSEKASNIIEVIFILTFLAAFEFGVATTFYVLAQCAFPPHGRDIGCAFVNTFQYLFHVLANFLFPVLQEAFSGGPSGDQDKGLAICFMIFGGSGLIYPLILFFGLRVYNRTTAGGGSVVDFT